jgi:hypothetical protein
MKRFYTMIVLIALLMVATSLTSKPAKANLLGQTDCSPANLLGEYLFFAPTTIVVGPGTVVAIPEVYLNTSPAAYASQGIVRFDGNGHVTLEALADLHGQLATPLSYDGDYTVNTNCTAKVTFANGTLFDVRLVQANNQQRLVSTTPGFVLSMPDLNYPVVTY